MSSALEYASDVVGRAIRQADSAADDAGQWLIRVTTENDGRLIYSLVDDTGHIHSYHDDLNILMSRIDGNGGTLGGAEIQALFPNEALTPLQIQALETVPNLQGWVDEGFELSQIQNLALNNVSITDAVTLRANFPDATLGEMLQIHNDALRLGKNVHEGLTGIRLQEAMDMPLNPTISQSSGDFVNSSGTTYDAVTPRGEYFEQQWPDGIQNAIKNHRIYPKADYTVIDISDLSDGQKSLVLDYVRSLQWPHKEGLPELIIIDDYNILPYRP